MFVQSLRTSCCVAVTLIGALTVVLLLANEVSVLMQSQRTEQVIAAGVIVLACTAALALADSCKPEV